MRNKKQAPVSLLIGMVLLSSSNGISMSNLQQNTQGGQIVMNVGVNNYQQA